MKFDPVITKIKLNPEQAVLACNCVLGRYVRRASTTSRESLCTSQALGTSRNSRSAAYCRAGTTNNFT